MNPFAASHFAAFVGIDWADQKHDVFAMSTDLENGEHLQIPHQPKSIDEWANALLQRFHGRPIAVACELKKGPLIYALIKHTHLVIYPLQPLAVARFREAFVCSGAKDDPTDAALQCELLHRHFHKFKPLMHDSVDMRTLQRLVEYRRTCIADRVRITNRICSALKNYYPQALEWFSDRTTVVFCDFLDRWPTLQTVKKARLTTLEKFFCDHNVRHRQIIDKRIESIKSATPLTVDNGVIHANQLIVATQIMQLRTLLKVIDNVQTQIHEIATRHADHRIFDSFPGAGEVMCARLMAAFGDNRERFHSPTDIQQLAGIAPVMERSGQSQWVHWRWAAPTFLRQTFVEWAGETVRYSFWANAFYRQQKERGKQHATIIRTLAYKWVRILFACWKHRKCYNETIYLNALRKKHSSLLEYAAKVD